MALQANNVRLETNTLSPCSSRNLTPATTPTQRSLSSPLGDESVRGYATDERPKNSGAVQMTKVIQKLEDAFIPCCVVGEPALIYYGATRVMVDWVLSVPTALLDDATSLFQTRPEEFQRFRPCALKDFTSVNHLYPRFKLFGFAVFFVLLPAQACHLTPQRDQIEYDSRICIPYPTLACFAQSLLDTWNQTDLEDLVDGMNLTPEWGDQYLDLVGNVDHKWAQWRDAKLTGQQTNNDAHLTWLQSRRQLWHRITSSEAKKNRQGWKSSSNKETRFWKKGQKDLCHRLQQYD